MAEQVDDIKLFRQLREQLTPALSDAAAALLLRIEVKLGSNPVDSIPLFPNNLKNQKTKRITHKDRVRSFL